MTNPLLSLCIPTNGILEWVKPVLDSIYKSANINEALYEVIVADNGNNADFAAYMEQLTKKYYNLRYVKTTANGFLNQIECFKMAKGEYIKFINHRMKLLNGSLSYLVDFVEKYQKDKPVTYFSNGSLNLPTSTFYNSFDSFMNALSYYSSWSGGIGIWKKDFCSIQDFEHISNLFPHFVFLTCNIKSNQYIIDNSKLLESVDGDSSKKGRYNLFYAFGVEYPGILLDLLKERKISSDSFLHIKKDLKDFLAELYLDFVIQKKRCSYELDNAKEYIGVFFNFQDLLVPILKQIMKKILRKVKIRLI
mgnify:CR=1 FL=1